MQPVREVRRSAPRLDAPLLPRTPPEAAQPVPARCPSCGTPFCTRRTAVSGQGGRRGAEKQLPTAGVSRCRRAENGLRKAEERPSSPHRRITILFRSSPSNEVVGALILVSRIVVCRKLHSAFSQPAVSASRHELVGACCACMCTCCDALLHRGAARHARTTRAARARPACRERCAHRQTHRSKPRCVTFVADKSGRGLPQRGETFHTRVFFPFLRAFPPLLFFWPRLSLREARSSLPRVERISIAIR